MSEHALHVAVAAYLRVALRPPAWFSTIGHGGGGKVRGAMLKAAGMRPGMPDLLVFGPENKVVGIELKAARGRLSPEQREVALDMARCGHWYAVCKTIDEVEAALRDAEIPVHATTLRAA